ncbi:MAG: UvrD-helicase domain-containing protein [Planctomycetaceae bacterium]|nr:UvrD-helicase domain-containing protein [Planctomycetaceae bacterium]
MSTTDASLTAAQAAAVDHRDGPLLVLAGPGSGKTRVVTRRLARLVESGVRPRSLLAITFTNKAADEMQRRVAQLMPGARVWVSTFHRFCARLLREHAAMVGLQPNFTILDAGDQRQALRQILRDEDLDPVAFGAEKIGYRISAAKNDLIDADTYRRRYEEQSADHWQAAVVRVYPAYQRWLLASNAVDFDDLLLHTAVLLAENDELRSQLDERYRYIIVDEYQDTNRAQYQIVSALSQIHRNLCVTGDPDQSIYGWRGARIENILRFEGDYPDARVVRLEENFRSTQSIVRSADRLIGHNRKRKAKRLVTDNPEGEPVSLLCFRNEGHEAEGLAQRMQQLADAGRDWSDFAVFMRVNALSRQVERALMRRRIPHQVAAGAAFFDRAEVKDLIAYLRLLENPADRAAFSRIVNTPARNLGETSQRRLLRWANEQGLTPLEAAARAKEVPKLSKRSVAAFRAFAEMMAEFSLADAGAVAALVTRIINRTGYVRQWEGSPNEKDLERLENVKELVTAASEYDEAAGDERSLSGFLEQTALVNETDSLDTSRGQVTLMTLHAAKGLEYPVVFVLGVEQGLIPHERAIRDGSAEELEEERRLLFVGMTRAREQLFLTQTVERVLRGRTLPTIPSPFISELECTPEYVETSAPAPVWSSVPTLAANGDRSARDDHSPRPLLMTGAELLRGGTSQAELPRGFALGSQVRHPRYGVGTVVDIGGFGQRRTVTVTFRDDARTEKFVASQSPLQPVGH